MLRWPRLPPSPISKVGSLRDAFWICAFQFCFVLHACHTNSASDSWLKKSFARLPSFSLGFREGIFLIGGGGGGWAGALEGRVLSNFFYKLGRVKPVLFSTRGGKEFFFLARKKLLHVASTLFIQAKLPVEMNLNYFTGVEKFTYRKTIFS